MAEIRILVISNDPDPITVNASGNLARLVSELNARRIDHVIEIDAEDESKVNIATRNNLKNSNRNKKNLASNLLRQPSRPAVPEKEDT